MSVDLDALEQQYSLPSGLLSAVQQQESGGNPDAVSPKGAVGTFQFMPATAKQYGIDPTDPDQAAKGAAMMFSDLSDKYDGNVPSMLAAYNWGQGNVDRKGLENAPAETQNYIKSVTSQLGKGTQYAAADTGNMTDATVDSGVPDLSKMSDADLDALEAKAKGAQTPDLSKMSDADLDALEAKVRGAQKQTQQQPSSLLDALKSLGGGAERGAAGMAMVLPNLLNQAVAGPQELYRGMTGRNNDNSPMWQPFYSSEDVLQGNTPMDMPEALKPHNPQTPAGVGADLVGQLVGGMGVGKAMTSPNVANLAADETGMGFTPPPPPGGGGGAPPPAGVSNLGLLPEAAQGTTFASKPNALVSGLKANQQISSAYDADKTLQNQLYGDLNQKGSVFSIKAPELYDKLDNLTNYLANKVAVDTPEYRAYTELNEFKDNLASKYGISATPEKTSSIVDEFGRPITTPATSGVDAYGIQPSDLVDLKSTINAGLKPNKFTTAGSSKILDFKSYVQNALDNASELSPEFSNALDKAETQAAKVGVYKEDSLKPFWQPEDYVAWKAKQNDPTHPGIANDTMSRASTFLDNLNNVKAGRASIISQVLPKDQATAILRDAIVNAKRTTPSMLNAGAKLVTGHPIQAAVTVGKTIISPESSPLVDLAKQVKKAGPLKITVTPSDKLPDVNLPEGHATGGIIKNREIHLSKKLEVKLGRKPKAREVELASYVGAHGVHRLLNQKDVSMPAHKMFPEATVKEKQELFFNKKKPYTVEQIKKALV